MEDRATHTHSNTYENVKSPHSLSIYSNTLTCSPTSHNSSGSNGSCSCINHHQNFKSSTSCTHTYTSTTNTNTSSHFSTISNITLKSNSPAIMIPNNRRNSLSINSGDIIDNNFTVLQLTNSETIDTKDVYVMSHENAITPKCSEKQNIVIPKTLHKTLSVPNWNTDIEESADEYDSEAHTITDEDIIIKRVLAKFNQQNQQIIRRKISFVDSFQFFQSNIDQSKKNMNSISYRYRNKSKNSKSKNNIKPNKSIKRDKKKRKSKASKKKHNKTYSVNYSRSPQLDRREHSESDPTRIYLNHARKISEGHEELLADISRRATIEEAPKSLAEYSKEPILSKGKKMHTHKHRHNKHKHRNGHSHVRTITPFDPIINGIFDTSDSDYDIGDLRDEINNKNKINNSKHKKTLTAINIQISDPKSYNSPSDSHTMSMNTPEPDIIALNVMNHSNNMKINMHRKTMSQGPRLMSNISNMNNTRRTASIVPNMEDLGDDIFNNIFIDMDFSDNEESNTQSIVNIPAPIRTKAKVIDSCSSPSMMRTGSVEVHENENNKEIIQTEWKELEALNEASDEEHTHTCVDSVNNNIEFMDDDMDDLDFTIKDNDKIKEKGQDEIKLINKVSKRHRRLISAPVKLKSEGRTDLHVYQTWNYFEEMSDSLKSDFNSDISDHEMDTDSDNENKIQNDNVTFGGERVFSTFTKELAITSENPKYLFECLSEVCVSLRSKVKTPIKIKHKIPFHSPILRYERVISFLKLLGFEKNDTLNAYIITKIDTINVDSALSSCQQQLIEISKKSATYEIITNSRLRSSSITNNLTIPPPPLIHEKKSDKPVKDELELEQLSDIDADRCQLYELIWSATHPNNSDHKAKDVILLCYILITSPLKFMKLLEARFFNDDHGRASRSYSSISNDSNFMYNPGYVSSANGSPTVGSALLGSSMGQSPTLPSTLPSLTTSSITFEYERIQSSYGVQKKVVHMIRLWMQKYWKQDWNDNYKLLGYIDMFVRKANKAYQNDIDFDEMEKNKGLELIATIHKTIQKQKAECKFHGRQMSASATVSNLKINSIQMCRPRSVSSNTEVVNREKTNGNGNDNGRKRRKSLHKRKFSLLSAPKMVKMRSYDSSLPKEIPNDLSKISNESICNQLALYLFDTFKAINARECLYQYSPMHKHKENICPNIQIYKDTFNNIVKWVQSTILLQQQVAKRARMIKKWIKVTDLLFNIRCFQGFVAVQCALASNAIYTLKDAWNQNNVLKRKHHTKFKEIKVIMSASHNFENLRRLQREAHAPLIPYFGIFCKDLIYIQEGVSKRNQDGMINWSKLWRISELIKDHITYQNTPYTRIIQEDIIMQNWLTNELRQAGTLKTEHLDKIAHDVAQKDKNRKIRHKKSFTVLH